MVLIPDGVDEDGNFVEFIQDSESRAVAAKEKVSNSIPPSRGVWKDGLKSFIDWYSENSPQRTVFLIGGGFLTYEAGYWSWRFLESAVKPDSLEGKIGVALVGVASAALTAGFIATAYARQWYGRK